MNRSSCSGETLAAISSAFRLPGRFVSADAYGNGHINDTFVSIREESGRQVRFLHQRINSRVFQNPRLVMENVSLVCAHIDSKLRRQFPEKEARRRGLTLIESNEGDLWWIDKYGEYWRTYHFIEDASGLEVIESPRQAREAARAFGQFLAMLADLPSNRLHETIPHFHDTRQRLQALRNAEKSDTRERASLTQRELDFANANEALAGSLLDLEASGEIPRRVTHNDTKLNNVLLCHETGCGLCVTDLDTVMPGLPLYDFGDMVRTATSPAAEDERDLSRVHARPKVFEALVSGFISSAGVFLNEIERAHLLTAGKLITYECGLRFLTDYLQGDPYFKTEREHQNLDRCRAQFQLLRSLEAQEDSLQRIVTATLSTGAGK